MAKTKKKSVRSGIPVRKAAKELQRMGHGGDTILAHISPREAMMLRRMGGSGRINRRTGLREFETGDLDLYGAQPFDPNYLAYVDAQGASGDMSAAYVPPVEQVQASQYYNPAVPVYTPPAPSAPQAATYQYQEPLQQQVAGPPESPTYYPPQEQVQQAIPTTNYVTAPTGSTNLFGQLTSSPEITEPNAPTAVMARPIQPNTPTSSIYSRYGTNPQYMIDWNTDVGPVQTLDTNFLSSGGGGLNAGDKIPTAMVPSEEAPDYWRYVYPDGTYGDWFYYNPSPSAWDRYFPQVVKGGIQTIASMGGPVSGGIAGGIMSLDGTNGSNVNWGKAALGAGTGAVAGYLGGGKTAPYSAANVAASGSSGIPSTVANYATSMAPATKAITTGAITAGGTKLSGSSWNDAITAGLIAGTLQYVGGKLYNTYSGNEVTPPSQGDLNIPSEISDDVMNATSSYTNKPYGSVFGASDIDPNGSYLNGIRSATGGYVSPDIYPSYLTGGGTTFLEDPSLGLGLYDIDRIGTAGSDFWRNRISFQDPYAGSFIGGIPRFSGDPSLFIGDPSATEPYFQANTMLDYNEPFPNYMTPNDRAYYKPYQLFDPFVADPMLDPQNWGSYNYDTMANNFLGGILNMEYPSINAGNQTANVSSSVPSGSGSGLPSSISPYLFPALAAATGGGGSTTPSGLPTGGAIAARGGRGGIPYEYTIQNASATGMPAQYIETGMPGRLAELSAIQGIQSPTTTTTPAESGTEGAEYEFVLDPNTGKVVMQKKSAV